MNCLEILYIYIYIYMENIIEKFDSKYLKYFVPLVGGQYYMGDNGNQSDFIYKIHDVLNFNSNGEKGKLKQAEAEEKWEIRFFKRIN